MKQLGDICERGVQMELTHTKPTSHQTHFKQHASHGPAQFDCETAILLRAIFLPIFERATGWTGLIDTLQSKGYHLAFRSGLLCLTDQSSGTRICGLRFLGLRMQDLVARLGRPYVLAYAGQSADGEVLRHPPRRIV